MKDRQNVMRNYQVNNEGSPAGNIISVAELRARLKTYPTAISKVTKPNQSALKLFNAYHLDFGGFSMHAIHRIELLDISIVAELPAAISLNFVLKGTVQFAIAGQFYQLDATKDVACAAYVINRDEIFTRILKKDSEAIHLNIFAERKWLESRAMTHEAKEAIGQIFKMHNILQYWKFPKNMIRQVEALIKHKPKTLPDIAKTESIVLDIFAGCIKFLETFAKMQANPEAAQVFSGKVALKRKVDEKLLQRCSLQEIADSLNLSVSTLQRKFKKSYGVTVNYYCRQRLLEIARHALIIQGVSIGEAAYIAGYNHPSNFVAAFKKQFNHTPANLISLAKVSPQ